MPAQPLAENPQQADLVAFDCYGRAVKSDQILDQSAVPEFRMKPLRPFWKHRQSEPPR